MTKFEETLRDKVAAHISNGGELNTCDCSDITALYEYAKLSNMLDEHVDNVKDSFENFLDSCEELSNHEVSFDTLEMCFIAVSVHVQMQGYKFDNNPSSFLSGCHDLGLI